MRTDWSIVVLIVCLFLLIVLFWGTPDLHDALVKWAMASCPR